MQILTIAGNVGGVKNVKEVSGDSVLNFSVAVDNGKDKNGEKRDPTWYDCALWGKRATALAPYITKGSKLALSGRPGARAYEGKAYLSLTVDSLTFMSSAASAGDKPQESKPSYADDDVPF